MFYVDVDGVLANLDKWLLWIEPNLENNWDNVYEVMAKNYEDCYKVSEYIHSPKTEELFDNLRLRDDYFVLTCIPKHKIEKYVQNNNPDYVYTVLRYNRYKWLMDFGVSSKKIIITDDPSEKILYCQKGDYLYDDRVKTIQEWNLKGGNGILVDDKFLNN